MAQLHPFVHLMFIGIIALFPVVNPLGTAFIVMPYFHGVTHAERKRAVRKITAYAFGICTVALFAGHWIMELFGISIPVVQLAGGIMICKFGWEFLAARDETPGESKPESNPGANYHHLETQLFYPITFPITTGAGTMSVLFTLSAHGTTTYSSVSAYLLDMGAIQLAIVVMCALIYVFYLNAEALVRILGNEGEKIFNRIIAFLIFCVGLQIAVSGAKELFLDAKADPGEKTSTEPARGSPQKGGSSSPTLGSAPGRAGGGSGGGSTRSPSLMAGPLWGVSCEGSVALVGSVGPGPGFTAASVGASGLCSGASSLGSVPGRNSSEYASL